MRSATGTFIVTLVVLTSSPACLGSDFLKGLQSWKDQRASCGNDRSCLMEADDGFRPLIHETLNSYEIFVIELECNKNWGWGRFSYMTDGGWYTEEELPC